MHLGIRTTCLALALAFNAGNAFAACQLQKIAELQVTMSGSRPLIDGSINGVPARFFIDSGAFMSILAKQRLGPYNLKIEQLPFGYRLYGFGGMVTPELTIARDFTLQGLGEHTFHKVAFLVTETT